jgi:hypothetical protein
MQVPAKHDLARLGRLVDEAVPCRRGLEAWRALLEAHATLMRQLQTDLVNKTGLDCGPMPQRIGITELCFTNQ